MPFPAPYFWRFMSSRLFDRSPEFGITRMFHYDEATGDFAIETIQDFDLDINKGRYRTFDERTPWKGDWHHVAAIPLPIYYEMAAEGKTEDQEYMKRWLNSQEFRDLRVRPGVL